MAVCRGLNIIFALIVAMPLRLYNYEADTYKDMSSNPVIIDMDFCGDVDDAIAVRMATRLDGMHVCTLKAVGLSVTSPDTDSSEVKALHGLLSYDGYGNIPIGTDVAGYKDGSSKYWDVLKTYSTVQPETERANVLYKKVLRDSYNKVTIITTGYLTNIEALLSDKEGYELVKNRCKKIVVMGGDLKNGWDNNFGHHQKAVSAAKYVIESCPVELIFVPQDIGDNIKAGAVIQQNVNDPLAAAISAWGSDNGRIAWDPFAVLIGCLPEKAMSLDYRFVDVSIADDGSITYKFPESSTDQRIVTKKEGIRDSQYEAILEGILGSD